MYFEVVKMVRLFRFIVSFLIELPIIIFAGYVLSVLWTWFIVGIFHLSPISVVEATGLVITVSLLTFHRPSLVEMKTEFNWEDWFCVAAYNLLVIANFLLFGWVIHQFM